MLLLLFFWMLLVVLLDSVGLWPHCYIFDQLDAGHHQSCEKVVSSYIIATFENQLHQLCHDIFWFTYRSVPALIFPKIRKAIEQA